MKLAFILIFLMSSFVAVAQDQNALVVKKAEELVLKRDRIGAIKHLVQALGRTKNKSKEKTILTEKLKTVAEMFFTDEGQKAYESALSLYFYSPQEARLKANRAHILEPGNTLIIQLLAYLELKSSNCDAAKNQFAQIPAKALTDAEISYQENLIFYCEKSIPSQYESKKVDFPLMEFFLGVRSALEGKPAQAKSHLNLAAEKDPQFPESFYWLWKLDETNEDSGIKYVQLCKNPDIKVLRKYKDFPFICSHVSEMPSFEVKDEI